MSSGEPLIIMLLTIELALRLVVRVGSQPEGGAAEATLEAAAMEEASLCTQALQCIHTPPAEETHVTRTHSSGRLSA